MTILSKSTNLLLCDLYDIQRNGVMVDTSLILDSMMHLNTFLARTVGVEEGVLGKIRKRYFGYQLDTLKKFRKHLFPLRVKLDSFILTGRKERQNTNSKTQRTKDQRMNILLPLISQIKEICTNFWQMNQLGSCSS